MHQPIGCDCMQRGSTLTLNRYLMRMTPAFTPASRLHIVHGKERFLNTLVGLDSFSASGRFLRDYTFAIQVLLGVLARAPQVKVLHPFV